MDDAQGRFNPDPNNGRDLYNPEKAGGLSAALKSPDGKD